MSHPPSRSIFPARAAVFASGLAGDDLVRRRSVERRRPGGRAPIVHWYQLAASRGRAGRRRDRPLGDRSSTVPGCSRIRIAAGHLFAGSRPIRARHLRAQPASAATGCCSHDRPQCAGAVRARRWPSRASPLICRRVNDPARPGPGDAGSASCAGDDFIGAYRQISSARARGSGVARHLPYGASEYYHPDAANEAAAGDQCLDPRARHLTQWSISTH